MTKVKLREYQTQAIHACLLAIKSKTSVVCQLPTGAGKSYLIAGLLQLYSGKVLVLSHSKEILEQNERALLDLVDKGEVGMFSAGIGRRETNTRVVIAGVGSVFRQMEMFSDITLIIIDEAHRVPNKNDATKKMYRAVFDALPNAIRIGMTATPYRSSGFLIYGGPENFFSELCFQRKILELTPEYLAPLVDVSTWALMNTEGARVIGGDFIMKDIEQINMVETLLDRIFDETTTFIDTDDRKSVLIFCSTKAHGRECALRLKSRGKLVKEVYGTTSKMDRIEYLEEFKRGEFQYLVSVSVLTTGYDAPNVDAIVLLRPTKEQTLYVQMIGRGCRQSANKQDCVILDFAGNRKRFPELDGVFSSRRDTIPKRKPEPVDINKAVETRAARPLVSVIDISREGHVTYEVTRRILTVKPHSLEPDLQNLNVTYILKGRKEPVTKCLSVESKKARWHAEKWFAFYGWDKEDVPETAEDAYVMVSECIPKPKKVVVDTLANPPYGNIVMEILDDGEDSTEELDLFSAAASNNFDDYTVWESKERED